MNNLVASVQFFILDSLKIVALLVAINYLMAIVRHYLPVEKIRDYLQSRKWYGLDYFLAAIFGALTPFCSCSSIPLFVGFLRVGIPIGVTFAFLITSPLINEAAIALFIGLLGWKITLLYVVAGISLGMLGGLVLSKTNAQRHINSDVLDTARHARAPIASDNPSKIDRELLAHWWAETRTLTLKLTPYTLAGVALGAIIHGYVPRGFFENALRDHTWWTVPVATLVAVPLYSNAVAVIPVMQSLVEKGVPLGTAMAFMMATVGLSLPEAMILKKIMSMKLLVGYFGVVAAGVVVIGYLFNQIL